MSAQPVGEERFPQLAEITAQREAAMRRYAETHPQPDPEDDLSAAPRFTITYRKDGKLRTADLDQVPDEALPERVRRWRHARKYAAVEDIREMADHGETLAGAAARLTRLRGYLVTPAAVERQLHNHGAHDVVWKLKANTAGEPEPESPDWWRDRFVGPLPTLPPEEAAEARRRFIRGPDNAGIGATYRDEPVTPSSPFARLRHGRPVHGVKL